MEIKMELFCECGARKVSLIKTNQQINNISKCKCGEYMSGTSTIDMEGKIIRITIENGEIHFYIKEEICGLSPCAAYIEYTRSKA